MARHNRDGSGADQRGYEYHISYQPDWLKLVKVTRALESGRQSTKTLFRNPADRAEAQPGERVRTQIRSEDQDLDIEVVVSDPGSRATRVRITCEVEDQRGRPEEVEFTLENGIPLEG